jgi:hypothetical protein
MDLNTMALLIGQHWNDVLFAHVTVGMLATLLLIVIGMAKLIVSTTGTPDPATAFGRIYRIIEVLALILGKAKAKAKDGGAQPGSRKAILPPLMVGMMVFMLSACGTINPYLAGIEAKGASDYQGARANLQTADDMAFTIWVDQSCNIKLGALKRNATGNNAAVIAALSACPIPNPHKNVEPTDLLGP